MKYKIKEEYDCNNKKCDIENTTYNNFNTANKHIKLRIKHILSTILMYECVDNFKIINDGLLYTIHIDIKEKNNFNTYIDIKLEIIEVK